MTPAELRLKSVVRQLVDEGRYPGTATVCRRLGFNRTRLDLSGREMRWRREALEALGWRYEHSGARSWSPVPGSAETQS